ncbi:MAG: amidohydrolase [Chlamydiia bacterium]|nr:amidohydrolase [Chlamydiia bacterium]
MKTLCTLLCALSCFAAEKQADQIFFGGPILTVNDEQPTAEAVAVYQGKIVFVGPFSEAQEFQETTTKLINLQGNTLLPGFIEPHTHLLFQGLVEKLTNVSALQYKTIDSILEALQEAAQKGPVIAFGYDPSLMTEPGDLGFTQLNAVSDTVPILVISQSGHIAYGNRKAFDLAGITDKIGPLQGGSFGRTQQGLLNGKAYELPAIAALMAAFKTLAFDYAQIAKTSAFHYAEKGFTTVTDLALGLPFPTPVEHIQTLQALAMSPDAPIRLQGYVISPLLERIGKLKRKNTPNFVILGIKIWADGSLQGYTAALKKRYRGKNTCGTLNYTQDALNALVLQAHRKNLQIAIHANGDQAIAYALTAYETALDKKPAKDPRFRVEHATIADHALLQKMALVSATPSFTNPHVYYYGQVMRDQILGNKRANSIDSARTAKSLGMKFSFNDDAPLSPPNPLLLMEIAVTREMEGGGTLNGEETITIDDAIKAFTIYPAWQSFREKELGSIEVGKYADFVILDHNPKTTKPHLIHAIRVLETWLNGKRIYTERGSRIGISAVSKPLGSTTVSCPHISNIGQLTVVEPRALSHQTKSDYCTTFGIHK